MSRMCFILQKATTSFPMGSWTWNSSRPIILLLLLTSFRRWYILKTLTQLARAHTHVAVKYEGKRTSFSYVPFVFKCSAMRWKFAQLILSLGWQNYHGAGAKALPPFIPTGSHTYTPNRLFPKMDQSRPRWVFRIPLIRTFLLLRKTAVRLYTFCFIQSGWICPNIVHGLFFRS